VISRRVLAVVSGLLILLPAACTGAPSAPRPATSASRPLASASQGQAGLAGTRRHAGEAAGTVTLAFAGDVNFAGRTAAERPGHRVRPDHGGAQVG